MVGDPIYRDFEKWFLKEIKGDRDFSGWTAEHALQWAAQKRQIRMVGTYCDKSVRDELLALPSSGVSFTEFYSTHQIHAPRAFPSDIRKGGGPDRGHSLALHREMRKRAPKSS
jgi:hypothetical protein